jgi:hypothetical protein
VRGPQLRSIAKNSESEVALLTEYRLCGNIARLVSPTTDTALRLGYKASAEQFGPSDLLRYSVLAEELGFDSIAV